MKIKSPALRAKRKALIKLAGKPKATEKRSEKAETLAYTKGLKRDRKRGGFVTG
jgi:hypothetical protein